MTDDLIRDVTGHNEETLFKVHSALQELGLNEDERTDIIAVLLRGGILFRERYEEETGNSSEAVPELVNPFGLTPEEELRNHCLQWAWEYTRSLGLSLNPSRSRFSDPFELAEKLRAYIKEGKV